MPSLEGFQSLLSGLHWANKATTSAKVEMTMNAMSPYIQKCRPLRVLLRKRNTKTQTDDLMTQVAITSSVSATSVHLMNPVFWVVVRLCVCFPAPLATSLTMATVPKTANACYYEQAIRMLPRSPQVVTYQSHAY